MQFIPSEDIVVTDLGWYDHNADGFFNGPHAVGIYRVNDQELVASAVCDNNSVLENGFRYQPIANVVLDFGQQYLLVGHDPAGNGDFVLRDLDFDNIMSHPNISVEGTRDENGVAGLVFPDGSLDTTPSSWRIGANFKLLVSDQDSWTGNSPIDGRFYFNWGPNWLDQSEPGEIDNSSFSAITQTVDWSNSGLFSGDTVNRNLDILDSDLTFQTVDLPVRTLSLTEEFNIEDSLLTLGNGAGSSMNISVADRLNPTNSDLTINGDSQIFVADQWRQEGGVTRINDAGLVNAQRVTLVGLGETFPAIMEISGPQAILEVDQLDFGFLSPLPATVSVEDGGSINARTIGMGFVAGPVQHVMTVTGPNSSVIVEEALRIGISLSSRMNVFQQGYVECTDAGIGSENVITETPAVVRVNSGGVWNVSEDLEIGTAPAPLFSGVLSIGTNGFGLVQVGGTTTIGQKGEVRFFGDGRFEFGEMQLSDFADRIVTIDGVLAELAGAVIFDKSQTANTVEAFFQGPNFNTTEVSIIS